MRAPCAILCLTAWLLGALNQVTVMLMAPNRLVIFGTDLTQEGAQLLWHQTLLTFVGLALAGAGLFKHRLAPILTIAASVFYLSNTLTATATIAGVGCHSGLYDASDS